METINVKFTKEQYYLLITNLLNAFNEEYNYQSENDCNTESLKELYGLIEAIEIGYMKKYYSCNHVQGELGTLKGKISHLDRMRKE